MNIAIICNSYPTEINPHDQIFIKKIKESIECDDFKVEVCYNKIFDFWKNPVRRKGFFANIIKYTVFVFTVLVFAIKKRNEIDVLFAHAVVFPTFFSIILKYIWGFPVVCYVHGGDVNQYSNSSKIYKLLIKKSLDKSDYIIVNSKDIFNKVTQITENDKIQIISPGVDTKVIKKLDSSKSDLKKKYDLWDDDFILLSAGNAIKRKGFDVLIKSLSELDYDILKNVYLVLLIDGSIKKDLVNLIENLDLSKYVSVRSKVNQDTLNEFYNIADVFIFPSRDEPLGLVGLEAMTAGTIVIGSKVGGIKEYLDDHTNGFLFEKENHYELAEQIEFVYKNFSQLDFLYQNMEEVASKHSIDNSAKAIRKILKNVTKSEYS